MHEFPGHTLSVIKNMPICEFFLLTQMAEDSAGRFGIGGLLSAFSKRGLTKAGDTVPDTASDADKLASLGIGPRRR